MKTIFEEMLALDEVDQWSFSNQIKFDLCKTIAQVCNVPQGS